jgi:hypothetical protein
MCATIPSLRIEKRPRYTSTVLGHSMTKQNEINRISCATRDETRRASVLRTHLALSAKKKHKRSLVSYAHRVFSVVLTKALCHDKRNTSLRPNTIRSVADECHVHILRVPYSTSDVGAPFTTTMSYGLNRRMVIPNCTD